MKIPHHWNKINQIKMMKTMTTYHYSTIRMAAQKETKIIQRNPNQVFRKKYEKGVIYFQAEKKDPMIKLEATENVLGVVTTQQYSFNAGQKIFWK